MEDQGYKAAYLHLFSRLADLIETLEATGYQSDVVNALKCLQLEAEERFISAEETVSL